MLSNIPVRCLFIPTLVSGVVYWRMFNPVKAAFKTKAFDGYLLWWQKDIIETMHPWQIDITNPSYRARITGEIDANVKLSDVVVMGLIHSQAGLSVMQGIRECYGKPVIMEIDDNMVSCPSYNPASNCYAPGSEARKYAIQQMREADAIVVTTPYLKELYSEFNDHIYVVPNCIDFDTWGKVQHKKNKGKITVGWVGGASHNNDLKIIEPAIDVLTKKYPEVEFLFGHGMHPDFRDKKGVRWISKFSRIDKYAGDVAKMGFDIGMAPLVDNAFNRSKSNLRWLEYSALGIPTVASRVGHFAETLHDGVDGILCDTSEDFINGIESLIVDKSKRRMMGQDAKNRVFKDFNVDQASILYGKILEEVRDRGQVKRTVPVIKDSNYKQSAEVV